MYCGLRDCSRLCGGPLCPGSCRQSTVLILLAAGAQLLGERRPRGALSPLPAAVGGRRSDMSLAFSPYARCSKTGPPKRRAGLGTRGGGC